MIFTDRYKELVALGDTSAKKVNEAASDEKKYNDLLRSLQHAAIDWAVKWRKLKSMAPNAGHVKKGDKLASDIKYFSMEEAKLDWSRYW